MKNLFIAICMLLLAASPLVAQQGASGSITTSGATCATTNACVASGVAANSASGTIQLSGTFTGTIQFESSVDGGATWSAISGIPLTGGPGVSSATTANTWRFNVSATTGLRARASAFASGSAAVTILYGTGSASTGGIGGGATFDALGGGTNTSAAMVVSTGASLAASGSGTIAATSVPFSGVAAGTNAGPLVVGTGGSLSVSGTGTITATATALPSPTANTVMKEDSGGNMVKSGILDNATLVQTSELVNLGGGGPTSYPLTVHIGTDLNLSTRNVGGVYTLSATNDADNATIPLGLNLSILQPGSSGGTALGTSLLPFGALFAGAPTFSGAITSTLATGTAPFTVASTTQVANLNAATAGTAGGLTGSPNIAVGTVTETTVTQNGLTTTYNSLATTGNGLASVQASPSVITIGSGSNIASTSLCSTTLCPAGDYDVAVYIDITTACTTTGSYIVWLGWTDDAAAKTGSSTTTFIPINGLGVTQSTGALALASTTNYGQGEAIIHTTGAATNAQGSINYGATATACGTGGPMIGKMYLTVTRRR